eukprot:gene8225-5747_t
MLLELYWIYAVASWCMSWYVFFSSGEGLQWFATFQNYLLIFGAVSGAALCMAGAHIPAASLLVVFAGWSLYAFLVISRYWRYKLWRRHIIPVALPLLFISSCDVYRHTKRSAGTRCGCAALLLPAGHARTEHWNVALLRTGPQTQVTEWQLQTPAQSTAVSSSLFLVLHDQQPTHQQECYLPPVNNNNNNNNNNNESCPVDCK